MKVISAQMKASPGFGVSTDRELMDKDGTGGELTESKERRRKHKPIWMDNLYQLKFM